MIGGKEYAVTPAEKDGVKGCWVTYGSDQKYWWTPQGMFPKKYNEIGPAYIVKNWGMKTGLRYPHDLTADERVKQWDGREWWKRFVSTQNGAQMLDQANGWKLELWEPSGKLRRKIGSNYKIHTQRHPEYRQQDPDLVSLQRVILTEPVDVKGLALISRCYDNPEKNIRVWLYLPSVKRVRRMSTGAKGDYAFGTPCRNEDWPQLHYIDHNYKLLGYELFNPGPEVYNYNYKEAQKIVDLEQKDQKGFPFSFDNAGELCAKIECTPSYPNWWFQKKVIYVSTSTLNDFFYAYDDKGQLIYSFTFNFRPLAETSTDVDPSYLLWGVGWISDAKSGYKGTWAGATRQTADYFNRQECDINMDPASFDPESMTQENYWAPRMSKKP